MWKKFVHQRKPRFAAFYVKQTLRYFSKRLYSGNSTLLYHLSTPLLFFHQKKIASEIKTLFKYRHRENANYSYCKWNNFIEMWFAASGRIKVEQYLVQFNISFKSTPRAIVSGFISQFQTNLHNWREHIEKPSKASIQRMKFISRFLGEFETAKR